MRTTLTIDDDVNDLITALARETGQPFKVIVNDALRRGLADRIPALPPFDYEPHRGNLLPGIDDRRFNELIWEHEEERLKR